VMLRTKFVLILCASSILTACSNPPAWWPGQRGGEAVLPPPVEAPALATAQDVAPPQAVASPVEVRSDELPRVFDEITTLVWRGDAAVVLETMAVRVGFRFERVGEPGQRGGNIDVKAVEKPLIDVLRMISDRLSGRAEVVLDIGTLTLELRYAS